MLNIFLSGNMGLQMASGFNRLQIKYLIYHAVSTINRKLEEQYERPGLLEAILKGLELQGIDPEKATRSDLSGVDEFHVRGAAVSKELAGLTDLGGKKVLDIGCGLGGPSRMLADEYDCTVTGLDLSSAFIETAIALTELLHLSDRVRFVQGDATDLPFADAGFDVVWTQHVQMNIERKQDFYREMARVLASGGEFLYYDIFRKGEGRIHFPVPWADHPGISFLFPIGEMKSLLESLGFQEKLAIDQTAPGIAFFENLLQRISKTGPPTVGLNLIMQQSTIPKLTNLLDGLKRGQLYLQSGIFLKTDRPNS